MILCRRNHELLPEPGSPIASTTAPRGLPFLGGGTAAAASADGLSAGAIGSSSEASPVACPGLIGRPGALAPAGLCSPRWRFRPRPPRPRRRERSRRIGLSASEDSCELSTSVGSASGWASYSGCRTGATAGAVTGVMISSLGTAASRSRNVGCSGASCCVSGCCPGFTGLLRRLRRSRIHLRIRDL